MKRPNTFIIGAPKCGTTSLAGWMGKHPDIFVSNPKEPHFFCRPALRRSAVASSVEEYETLFSRANGQMVLAEASTGYMYDETALPRLLDYQPAAKCIVMLRNPAEMAVSYHAETVRSRFETIESFEQAWRAIGARRRGRDIPPRCPDPLVLDYEAICALGTQLARVCSLVPHRNLHVVFLDDLKRDPRRQWLDLLAFLDLPDDGRTEFPRMNAGYWPRAPRLHEMVLRFTGNLKRSLGLKGETGLVAPLLRAGGKAVARERPRSRVRQELADAFGPEIDLIEDITGRNCSSWRARAAFLEAGSLSGARAHV